MADIRTDPDLGQRPNVTDLLLCQCHYLTKFGENQPATVSEMLQDGRTGPIS